MRALDEHGAKGWMRMDNDLRMEIALLVRDVLQGAAHENADASEKKKLAEEKAAAAEKEKVDIASAAEYMLDDAYWSHAASSGGDVRAAAAVRLTKELSALELGEFTQKLSHYDVGHVTVTAPDTVFREAIALRERADAALHSRGGISRWEVAIHTARNRFRTVLSVVSRWGATFYHVEESGKQAPRGITQEELNWASELLYEILPKCCDRVSNDRAANFFNKVVEGLKKMRSLE